MTVEGLCDINVCIACPREETPGNYVMGSCKIVCHESNILSPKLFVFRGQIPVFRLKRGGNSNGSRYWVVVAHARLKLLFISLSNRFKRENLLCALTSQLSVEEAETLHLKWTKNRKLRWVYSIKLLWYCGCCCQNRRCLLLLDYEALFAAAYSGVRTSR